MGLDLAPPKPIPGKIFQEEVEEVQGHERSLFSFLQKMAKGVLQPLSLTTNGALVEDGCPRVQED